jgi:predicted amidohydrolase
LIDREIYNCAVFIDQRGEICGKHHKVRFAEGYHPMWNFNRIGMEIRAFDTPFGRAG